MKLIKLPHLLFCTLVLFIITHSSCKKTDNPNAKSADAIIIDTGSSAVDGCGWLIKTDADSTYSPVNLSSEFQVDSLRVHITYNTLTTRFYCGSEPTTAFLANPGIEEMHLYTISKK